ncbi:MAG: hypothetical protein KGD65_12815 [Candidatus Lokiarchaeota archaeon]|nr:hypothetical protein [Candidatus Lokiarchaeota archaeon]
MKKISYSLRIGIVGNIDNNKRIFFDSIKQFAINLNSSESYRDFLVVFEDVPIKTKVFLAENLEELINKFNQIEKLDVLILTVNLFDPKTIYQYYKDKIEEFNEIYYFQGISILVGIDLEQIFKNKPSKNLRISRFNLEEITRYLNLIYCYEIFNTNKDILEIFRKIFNDFIFRYKYSSPELFDQAQLYGKTLMKEYNGQLKQF